MKALSFFILFLFVASMFTGCGETVRGVGRDMNRIGHGIKTIFISD